MFVLNWNSENVNILFVASSQFMSTNMSNSTDNWLSFSSLNKHIRSFRVVQQQPAVECWYENVNPDHHVSLVPLEITMGNFYPLYGAVMEITLRPIAACILGDVVTLCNAASQWQYHPGTQIVRGTAPSEWDREPCTSSKAPVLQ